MPTEIYIAVLAACICVVILTVYLIAVTVYIKARVDSVEKITNQIKGDLSGLIVESRDVVEELQRAATHLTKPMEDIEHIAHVARGWTDRADRMVDAVGTVAEPPLFFLSKNITTAGKIVTGVLQMLLNPKS